MRRLREIVEKRDTRMGVLFDAIFQVLILCSVIIFSLETLPDLTERHKEWLHLAETIIISLFCLEYLVRLLLAKNKWKFIFSIYGMIDLIAIIPFFVLQLDLSSIRIFRFMRLFRIFKFARYTRVFYRFKLALKIAKEELLLFISFTFLLLYIAGVGIYYFEHAAQPDKFSSVFASFWWAIATITTVGYGDIVPITTGGRIFTFFILMIGLGIVAIPAGVISASLSKARDEIEKEKRKTIHRKT